MVDTAVACKSKQHWPSLTLTLSDDTRQNFCANKRSGLLRSTRHVPYSRPRPPDPKWTACKGTERKVFVKKAGKRPSAVDVTATVDEDHAASIAVLANDLVRKNKPLAVASVNATGTKGLSRSTASTATVSVTVTCAPDSPVVDTSAGSTGGVSSSRARRLRGAAGALNMSSIAPRAIALTAHALARDVATAEAVEALRGAGVRSIVLKGPSIARWLYGDGSPRPYADSDVLVSPARLAAGARALESIGYSLHLDDRSVPGTDSHHLWLQRHGDGCRLELHWRLPGVRGPAEPAWRELSANTEVTSLAGVEVEFLGLPARALHLALHAAGHGFDLEKPLEDLRRGVRVAPASCWRAAAELAAAIGALDAFAAGLRAISEGAELAARLDLPGARFSTVMEMSAARASSRSVNVQKLLCDRGAAATARELVRVALPSAHFMRFRYPGARSGRIALATAYARRLVSLAAELLPVFRSVGRANLRSRR